MPAAAGEILLQLPCRLGQQAPGNRVGFRNAAVPGSAGRRSGRSLEFQPADAGSRRHQAD